MAKKTNIPVITDERGSLAVIEKVADFEIKRVYFIYDFNGDARGGHRHKKTKQILVCINGSCEVLCTNELKDTNRYFLNSPSEGLIVDEKDWHTMENFSENCILLVLASEYYDKDDYINNEY